MDAATISAIAEVIDAIPDGPYIVVESPFPALEQIGGGDINLGSTFGDVNLPFGEDFLDVHDEKTDDNSTNISVIGIESGAPETPETPDVVDSAIEPTPEPETGEVVADSAIEQPEVILPETPADSDAEQTDAPAETETPAETDAQAEQTETEETETEAPVESAPEQPAFDPVGFFSGAQK